jgi:cytochrome c-type biogenesis protein CcmF
MVLERKKSLKLWTLALALGAFWLTIVGTFMTRSGVFNSVHSFTQSSIGPTILVFLAVILIGSVTLLALRIDSLESDSRFEGPLSREGFFLINNLLFVLFTFTVLIGTVFPLVVEALKGKQMSVGRPYFDSMVVPIGAVLLFILGVGPALPWGRASKEQAKRALLPPLIGAAIVAAIGFALGVRNPWTVITLAFGGYAAQVTLGQMWLPVVQRIRRGDSAGHAIIDSQLVRGRRRFGSYLIHAGAVIVIVAIAVSSTMRTQQEVRLNRGESATVGGYTFTFTGTDVKQEPHRTSTLAHFDVTKNGRQIAQLAPRMNQYAAMRDPLGTPDVHTTLKGDIYLSIMNIEGDAVGVNVILTPMVGWIWWAVLLMGAGGIVALIPGSRAVALQARTESPVIQGDEVGAN